MKVLIHTNERPNKRFLLTLGKGITKEEVRKIIDINDDGAMRLLIAKSADVTEVSHTQATPPNVDFVVSPNGYTAERLA